VANLGIDGDIAVWADRSGSFDTIMMADLSAATPVPVAVFPIGSGPGANGDQFQPRISGDNIVWKSFGTGGFNDVFLHNLTNGTTTNISNTAFEDNKFEIDGDIVVWSATDPSTGSTNPDVFLFDGRGFDGTGTAPAALNIGIAGAVADTVPKVSGTNVVWDSNTDVFHYDVNTAITTNLTNAPTTFITEPDVSGSNVVWTNNSDVFLLDLNTLDVTNLGDASLQDTSPLVSGDNVVWLGKINIFNPDDLFFASGGTVAPTFTVDWDFGDGTVITDTTLDQTHAYADNGAFTITLTVTASDGRIATDFLSATIDNVAPIVAAIDGPTQALRGSTLRFSSSFTDPGTADTHTTAWTVTDAGGLVVATGTGTELDFTTDENGTFDVTFTVTDDDGGVGSSTLSTSTKTIIVGPDPLDPSQTTIQIAGSNGRDIIHVSKSHQTAGALKVLVYELDTH